MAPKEYKISKQAAAATTSAITLTIPERLEIIRKSGSATTQCHYGTIKDWIDDHTWYKHKEKITCKNSGQYRYCLINKILTDVTSPVIRNSTVQALEISPAF
jgi:hypothetical protein